MNLSIFNNRTATAALGRNGLARLALNAGGAYRTGRTGVEGQEWRGGIGFRSISSFVVSSSVSAKSAVSFCSNLGGSPSIVIPAPQGLAIGALRMHATAPLTLDPSANKQEGDA